MLRQVSGLALVAALALALAGCRSAPIHNVSGVEFATPAAVSPAALTLEDYRSAIIRGGARRGWSFEDAGPGHLIGNLAVRGKHFATVDVTFDTEEFSIAYKDSRNLDYDPARQVIHPNYNSWVSNLRNDIQTEIARMEAG